MSQIFEGSAAENALAKQKCFFQVQKCLEQSVKVGNLAGDVRLLIESFECATCHMSFLPLLIPTSCRIIMMRSLTVFEKRQTSIRFRLGGC